MKVAIVSCVYPPEPAVSARTSADLANAMRERGHDVTVICPFPSRPEGRVYDGFRRAWRRVTNERGTRVERRWSTVSRASTLASRFAENLTFGFTSAFAMLRMPRPDVAYLNSWPLFATGIAAFVLRARRVPYVVSVQDVYPDSLFVQRRRGARLLGWLLRRIDTAIAKHAESLIVLSRGFASLYERDRGVDPSRIHVVPNWIAENDVVPDAQAGRAYRRARGIPDDAFVVAYGGNVGVAAAVEQIIDAFRSLDSRFHLIVAGSGPRAAACVALAREIVPERIHFQNPWPMELTATVLSAANLLVLPTLGDQSAVSVPSKLLTYLLIDKPVLAIAQPDSEIARVIDDAGAGWCVTTDLADAIRNAATRARTPASQPTRTSVLRPRGGRAYALRMFGRGGAPVSAPAGPAASSPPSMGEATRARTPASQPTRTSAFRAGGGRAYALRMIGRGGAPVSAPAGPAASSPPSMGEATPPGSQPTRTPALRPHGGRAYALRMFGRETCLERVVDLLERGRK